MTTFEKLTGLADQGPHRRYADYLLFTVPFCHTCKGRGCGGGNSAVYPCGPCGGGGRAFRRDSPEIAAIVQKVLEYFPDAIYKPPAPPRVAPAPAAPPPTPVKPKVLPTCFTSVNAPRAPHPLARAWSALGWLGNRLGDLLTTAMLAHVVITLACGTVLMVVGSEFIWVVVLSFTGVLFTWLAIAHAEMVAVRWGTLTGTLRRTVAPRVDEEDEYRRR